MRRVRRGDTAARIEMMPLIDVVFLLLTFFIYALMVTVQAEVLPVALAPVGTGEAADPGEIVAITIDAQGDYYFDREPVSREELDRRLASLASLDPADRPRLFVALEESLSEAPAGEAATQEPGNVEGEPASRAAVDRGPLLIRLVGRLRAAGLTRFEFIGDPG